MDREKVGVFLAPSSTNVHSESVRYIMVIFECIIVLASVTDIIINRRTTFLLTSIAVSVDIFSKR